MFESPPEYAGVVRRGTAALVDFLVMAPLLFVFLRIRSIGPWYAVASSVLALLVAAAYHVGFNSKLGATPGKLALRLRIKQTGGSPIRALHALLRYSVDFALGAVSIGALAASAWALGLPASSTASIQPVAPAYLDWIANLWFFGNVASVLLSDRRRALHDLVAGTVVIRVPAEPADRVDCH